MNLKERIIRIAELKNMSLEDYIGTVKNKFVLKKKDSANVETWGNIPSFLESNTPVLFDTEDCDGEFAEGDTVIRYGDYLDTYLAE